MDNIEQPSSATLISRTRGTVGYAHPRNICTRVSVLEGTRGGAAAGGLRSGMDGCALPPKKSNFKNFPVKISCRKNPDQYATRHVGGYVRCSAINEVRPASKKSERGARSALAPWCFRPNAVLK